ncbi:MAG: alpha/beta hydrolase family protein [Solirubrobacteraceae bacterium]
MSSGRPSRAPTASRPNRRPSSSRTRSSVPIRRLAVTALLLALAPAIGAAQTHDRGPPYELPHPHKPAKHEPVKLVYRVRLRTVQIVERRTLTLPDGSVVPRTLVTYLRIPVANSDAEADEPLPLIVFAHGFDVTPAPYVALLTAWARAGFVVAAPVLPLENANAPGGATQSDLVNEPGDMTAVITWLIRRSRTPGSPFYGLIDPNEIAVAGHSDGGATALATGYGAFARDFRVRADIVMSGSEVPDFGYYNFAPGTPPLLAIQGTADTTNLPGNTYSFYAAASRPKFLLQLLGAGHLPPYTTEQPQLGVIERTTTAFLYRYLLHSSQALARLEAYGNFASVAALSADP